MPDTMRAAFVRAPWQFEVREIPVPEVRPGWVLVKVAACGICGTDLHIANLTDHRLTLHPPTQWQPFGHEVAGIVAAVGGGVSNVRAGDTVALESGSYCGVCEQCRNGRSDLCNRGENFWANASMGFADFILAPAHACVHFSGLPFEVACLAEPFGVAYDMVATAGIGEGDEVLALGLGPIGLMAIPLARRRGAARIYAANRSGGRRMELARAWGADEVVELGDAPASSILFRRGGVDRALVSAPPQAIPGVLPAMNYGGVVTFIGIDYGGRSAITLDANDFHFKKLQLRASHAAPALYFPAVLRLLADGAADGTFDGAAVVSHVLPLERIAEAMRLARDNRAEALKVVIRP